MGEATKKRTSEDAVLPEVTFQLSEVLFSRKLSYLSMGEADLPTEDGQSCHQLYLARLLRKLYPSKLPAEPIFPGMIYLRPWRNGQTVPFTASATPSCLAAELEDGSVECCFDQPHALRIRARGTGLRLFAPLGEHEAAIDRMDNTYQVCFFDGPGEFLMVPLRGKAALYSEWNWRKAGTERLLLDVEPDEEGIVELSIHFAQSNAQRFEAYRPFEACVEEAALDFAQWYSLYPEPQERFRRTHLMAVYGVWICWAGPLGFVKNRILLFEKNNCAFGWHSAYNAMAMLRSPDQAVEMLLSIFDYQDEFGQIPDLVDDRYISMLCTKPPFQGTAVLHLLDHMGDALTPAHCERLYEPMVRWYGWWMTLRDTDGDGIPQYSQGCESGRDSTPMLARGVPAECPDLMAYLILFAEALQRLAEIIGKPEEAKRWAADASHMLQTLLDEFWDGREFVARVSSSHAIAYPNGLEKFLPLLLGHRLPEQILDTLLDELEENYVSEHGVATRPLDDHSETYTYYLGFDNMILPLGLVDAGRTQLARRILEGYLKENVDSLPRMGYVYGERPSKPGINTEVFYEDYGKCSALSSGIFLVMENLLNMVERQEGGEKC